MSLPPSPVVVDQTVVHRTLSVDTSIRYALPYADSQCTATRATLCGTPRSTFSHWLSLNELPHRVESFASMALAGVRLVRNCTLDADADLPVARLTMLSPRPAGNDTTCWYVGRFCQEIGGWVMPPSADCTTLSAHHWSPAAHVASPG